MIRAAGAARLGCSAKVKPPLQRIQARLRGRSVVGALGGYRGPDRRNRITMPTPQPVPARRNTDNVIPLFPDRRKPRHPGLDG